MMSMEEPDIMFTNIGNFNGSITSIAYAPGEPHNIYVLSQKGIIIKYDKISKLKTMFLDLSEEVNKVYEEHPMNPSSSFADERGLLKLAFHPEYNINESPFKGVFIVMHSEIANPLKYDDVSRSEVPEPDHMTCIALYVYKNEYNIEQIKNTRADILCVPETQVN